MRKWGALGAAILLVGCGRIGFELQDNPDGDGGNSQSDAASFAVDPWDGLFSMTPPVAVTGLNSPSAERNCAFDASGLNLYFSSTRAPSIGGHDVQGALRVNLTRDFIGADHVLELSSSAEDGRFHSFDPLHGVMFSGRADGQGGTDIWSLTRNQDNQDWALAQAVNETNINSSADEYDPWVSPDGLAIYYISNRNGGAGSQDLYHATRPSIDAEFGVPTMVTSVSTGSSEGSPTLSPDQLFIVFDRETANNDRDLFYSRRSTLSENFGSAQPVPLVNTPSGDSEACIGLEGDFYFASDRPGGAGSFDIYRSRFVPL